MKSRQKLRQAINALYSRGSATLDSYTSLVLDCVRANDVHQAKRLQAHMDLHLFQAQSTFVHNRILHLYAKFGKLTDARRLFDKMPMRDVFSWNAMLSAYAKLGLLDDLWEVFNAMYFRDSVSYNTVIASLAGSGRSNKALEVIVRMKDEGFEPTEYTCVSALQACTQLLDLRHGRQIHGKVITGDMLRNVFVCNALADMYAKCGDIDRSRWLFDGIVCKNVVSWNSMISAYVKKGNPCKSIELFHEMQATGLKPDQVTISNILSAYCQQGNLEDARKMFDETKKKDEVCWTTMIVGYAQNGREEEALMLFGNMLSDDVKPDSFTISSVVSSCAKLASLCHGQVVHCKAIATGVDSKILVSSALVDMYCKCGVTDDARVVFEMMPTRNIVTWNAMIGGYAQNGYVQEALFLFERMLQESFQPDKITFVGVLSACISGDLIQEGHKYFASISQKHGMTPSLGHYACMISLLGRSGSIDKAVKLINHMPHEPDHLIWSTLLSISTKKGDIKHAVMAARHLFVLDPLNAGSYIMLSNMYAACGRWKDVARVRSLMKKNNVKKFAGYSWIEIDNEVHKFVSEDRSHPESERIYAKLNHIIEKLQEIGYDPDTKRVLHAVGEEEKFKSVCYHSEKLALACGLMKKPHGQTPVRIIKNIRVCDDCHMFMKFASVFIGRTIVLRDSSRFHHFSKGLCSCKDNW